MFYIFKTSSTMFIIKDIYGIFCQRAVLDDVSDCLSGFTTCHVQQGDWPGNNFFKYFLSLVWPERSLRLRCFNSNDLLCVEMYLVLGTTGRIL